MNEQASELAKAESGERKAAEAGIAHPDAAITAAAALSPFRPMSDEERAELEAVYQDRGCGVECDPDSPTCGPLAPRAETQAYRREG